MLPLSILSEWKSYKRLSSNKAVKARLVAKGRRKYMEMKEVRLGDFQCPQCDELLSQASVEEIPNFLLEPWLFHEKHRPV